jgi:nucleotide-binding universal stress UspA family protein
MSTPLESPSRPFTVVVATDFSLGATRAIATARTLCTLTGGGWLHVVHALSLVDLSSEMAASPVLCSEVESDHIRQARERLTNEVRLEGLPKGSKLTFHVEAGVPHEVITKVGRECGADLIVVGTRGLEGLRRMLAGSVAEHVTRHASCSVVTVRPREMTPAETIEPGCPDCIAATAAHGGEYTRCAHHHTREARAHTYRDLDSALGGPFAF